MIGVKNAGQTNADLGKMTWRKTLDEIFFSSKEEQTSALDRRSTLRECLMEVWDVDTHQALRFCKERHVQVTWSQRSYASFDRVHDPWPS